MVDLDQAIIAYYGMNDPIMTDSEFDAAFSREYPNGPSPFEVYKSLFVEDGRKRDLTLPMLSLSKVHSEEDITRWVTKMKNSGAKKIIFSPKFDGLPAQVTFSPTGEVLSAVTRGNGVRGEDVTYAVSHINGIHKLKDHHATVVLPDGKIVATGEVCLRREDLNSASLIMGTTYKHARNAASGILRSTGKEVSTGAKLLTMNPHWGKAQSGTDVTADISWIDAIHSFHRMFRNQETELGVLDDGVVLHAADSSGQILTTLGANSHVPYYAVAYKFENELTIATLVDVVWQRTRTKFSPVAVFDPPVNIDGVDITKASLHNQDIINQLGIAIGDEVYITRANGVIPQVVKLANAGSSRTPIPSAPVHDGANTVSLVSHVLTVLDVRGSGPVLVQAIANLIDSKDVIATPGVAIRGVIESSKTPDVLTQQGVNVAQANANKFALAADEALRSADPAHWLAMAGATGVGRRMSSTILQQCGSLASLREKLENGESLIGEGVGTSRSDALHAVKDTVFDVLDVAESVNPGITSVSVATPATSDKTFVITGGFTDATRSEATDALLLHGYSPSSSVSKNTSVLIVAGDNAKPSSKTKKAESLGIPVVFAVTLEDLLKNNQLVQS